MTLRNFWEALKRVFKRKRRRETERETITEPKYTPKPLSKYVPKPGYKATRQDISRFMKHGRQAPWYRRSVKERKKPEED